MRIRWTLEGLQDVEHIAEYIAESNLEAARLVVHRIRQSTENLETFPNAGRPSIEDGIRELIVQGTSYIIPYRIQEEADEIQILRVLHSSQKRPNRSQE